MTSPTPKRPEGFKPLWETEKERAAAVARSKELIARGVCPICGEAVDASGYCVACDSLWARE